MDASVKSATLSGVDGRVLEVTAVAEPGLSGFEQHGMHGWDVRQRAASLRMVSNFAAADALRVAWTFADLNGHKRPTRDDCAAALGLRMGEMR